MLSKSKRRVWNQGQEIHYGWIVVAGCGLIMFIGSGLATSVFPVLLTPLMERFGLTKTEGSSLISLQYLVSIVSMIICGRAYKLYSVRLVALACALFMAGGYWLYAAAASIRDCCIAAAVLGMGWGGGSLLPVSVLLVRWFAQGKGLAMALATSCSGLATIFFAPIVSGINQRWGLSPALLVLGGITALLSLTATLVIRNNPEDKGLEAYGSGISGHEEDKKKIRLTGLNIDFIEALRTKQFYFAVLVWMLIGLTIVATISHMAAFVVFNGYSAAFAARIVSIMGLFTFIGKFIYGWIIDRFGSEVANVYIISMLIAGFVTACFAETQWILIPYGFAVLFGLGNPLATVGMPIWANELFGSKDYTRIFTSLKVAYTCSMVVGITLTGLLVDLTGSYAAPFGLYAVLLTAGLVCIQLVYKSTIISRS